MKFYFVDTFNVFELKHLIISWLCTKFDWWWNKDYTN